MKTLDLLSLALVLAGFSSAPLSAFADGEPTPLCGPTFPQFNLQSSTAGATPLTWGAFPAGAAIDYRTLEYRVRVTNTQTGRSWNYAYEQSITPYPGQPDAFTVENRWICADTLGTPPAFSAQVTFPDSVRFGAQTGARSTDGYVKIWTTATADGNEVQIEGNPFHYPRIPAASITSPQWNGGTQLFKVAPSLYEMRLMRTETQGILHLEHSARMKLVVPGSSADHS